MNLKKINDSSSMLNEKIEDKKYELEKQIGRLKYSISLLDKIPSVVEEIVETIKSMIPSAGDVVERRGSIIIKVNVDDEKLYEVETEAKECVPSEMSDFVYVGSGDGKIYIDIDLD